MGNVLLYVILALIFFKFTTYLFTDKNAIGRWISWGLTAICGVSLLLLLSYFTRENYSIRYVYENSSRSLPMLYKVSGVWAGQEGTFLLWLAMTAFCVSFAAKRLGDFERIAMVFAAVVEMSLVVLIIRKSPFALVEGMVPTDGMGLNALLQNPWMAIHPPIVFLGYALATIPFGVSAAGAFRGDMDGWAAVCRPWTLAAWGVLGAGIALGSYWAYEVLGWGGYWGWDPVENASMLPWLTLGGLVHGVMLQKRKPDYAVWNVVLAQVSFLLVFFGTFMTRSGVLSNFSVHSFQGLELYIPLLLCLIGYTAIAGAVIASSYMKQKKTAEESKSGMAPTLLIWTINSLAILCFFILLGTTSPIVTSWFLPQPSPVSQPFYNGITYILGFVLAVLLAICPSYFAKLGGGAKTRWGAYALVGVLFAAAGVLAGIMKGDPLTASLGATIHVPRFMMLLLVFIGGAATAANVHVFIIMVSRMKWPIVSYLAHIGFALMVIAVVLSTSGTKTQHVVMMGDKPFSWRGYQFQLMKMTPNQESAVATVRVTGRGAHFDAKLTYVDEQSSQKMVKRPFIYKTALRDLYMSPGQYEMITPGSESGALTELKKGQSNAIEGYKVTFRSFDLSKMQQGTVGIIIDMEKDGKKTTVTPEFPALKAGQNAFMLGDKKILVEGIDASSHSVRLNIPSAEKQMAGMEPTFGVAVEASEKPGMALLWLGMFLVCLGSLLAMWRWMRPRQVAE